MIELATAAVIAKLVSDTVNSFDKIFRGYADVVKNTGKVTAPEVPPPDFAYADQPDRKAFVAKSRSTGKAVQTVTYEQLRDRLNERDLRHVETLSQAMENYERQWDAAFKERSTASGKDIGRLDAQLEDLAKQISDPLLRVLKFVEKMGLHLDDHFLTARDLAERYLKKA
ncbi:hypothetical protein [Bradyrhizobium liaoningense]|uniref:hypothetical protein n=1 Tax=Bradyrhizobium liaoningense TaxID=43992 RepID=UPI001BA876E5|nr:hypothetical protein [Bradyrhizobium liaoningense]MBR0712697.1 hypothetical protein [Bradyrhizobium liaoningense]